jgi:peptide deformylase
MALRRIRLYPDPMLRQPGARVESFDDALCRLVEDMVETMRAAPGIGLAAPQVGEALRVAVVDVSVGEDPAALRVLINPEVLEASGSQAEPEGCLSIPGFTEKVERPAAVTIVASDLQGEPYELHGEGLLARALLHEIDHLEGILFPDRLRGLRRERAKRALKRMLREAEAEWASDTR